MELIFLGTSAGVPTRTRNVTAILLNLQHPTQSGLWLFDCGEGTQHQLLHTAFNPGKLDKIFISHLHGDHLFGLPGLLCSRSMSGIIQPLTIYGPQGIYSAAIFLIPICISFDTAEKRRYATYLILNRRFSFEF